MEYFAKSVPNGGSKEEQVTLKQHLDDTVKCAQDFFEKFGHYFTEKEKAIIIEACRVHDLGKANIVFQSKTNISLSYSPKTNPAPVKSTTLKSYIIHDL
jgi:CRISPR-associated endonuclease/helicase Cas3